MGNYLHRDQAEQAQQCSHSLPAPQRGLSGRWDALGAEVHLGLRSGPTGGGVPPGVHWLVLEVGLDL